MRRVDMGDLHNIRFQAVVNEEIGKSVIHTSKMLLLKFVK